jgi:hypothetical protein
LPHKRFFIPVCAQQTIENKILFIRNFMFKHPDSEIIPIRFIFVLFGEGNTTSFH